jgi:flagellar biosynthesis protein FliR
MSAIPLELLNSYFQLPVFLLVFARLAGMIMFQPVLAALSVPAPVRVVLVLALTGLMLPFVEIPAHLPATFAGLALGMAQEVALGALLGMITAVMFVGLQLGGHLIAMEAGLAFGQIVDPGSEQNMSLLSSLYLQLGIMIFLLVGGHRVLMTVTIDSLQGVPLLSAGAFLWEGSEILLAALTLSFETGIRIAAPTVITMFLVNLAMGFVSRTLPQLNIMMLGFTVKGLLAFLMIAVSLSSMLMIFSHELEVVLVALQRWVSG